MTTSTSLAIPASPSTSTETVPVPAAAPELDRAAALKEATRAAHEALDGSIMRFNPFASLQRYGGFLQMQYAFHRDVAALFEDAALNRLFPDLQARSRLAQVTADLQDLGLPLPVLSAPVFCADRFSLPVAIGWLYVEEGSNLGAAFLYKMAAGLGLDGNRGARHLAPHPEGRAPSWRGFVAQLNAIALDAVAEQQVIQGASAAFAQVTSYVGRFCRAPLTENAA